MQRVMVHYSGRVQGVGFRATVRQIACGFDVTGAVRTLPDGRVELIAEGAADELAAFLAAIRESELSGLLAGHAETRLPARGDLRGFVIAR